MSTESAFGWLVSAGVHAALLFGGAVLIITHYTSSGSSGTGYGFGLRPETAAFETIERGPDRLDRKGVATDLPLSSLDGILSGAIIGDDDGDGGCCYCPYGSPSTLGTLLQDFCSRTRELRPAAARASLSTTHWIRAPLPEGAGTESLKWLARHQNPDGTWSASGFNRHCKGAACSGPGDGDFDEGVTSLAVLAFLRGGFTPFSREVTRDADREVRFGDVVKNGLKALIARQDEEGRIGARGSKPVINHILATLALSEAYGMARTELLRSCAQKAVDALVAAQNPGSGWRYAPRAGESDSFVTGWAVSTLRTAQLANIHVPVSAYEGAAKWYRDAYQGGWTRVAYTASTPDKSADHPTLVAMASLARWGFYGIRKEPDVAELLRADPPVWTAGRIEFCTWYFATQVMSRLHPDNDPYWNLWQEAVRTAVIANQRGSKHGCERGSWDPSVDRWGSEGGRVYGVAMNALTLDAASGRRTRYWSPYSSR